MLYEIASEKITNINYEYKNMINIMELNLSTDKENIEIIIYSKTDLYIFTIKQKDIERIYESITQMECYKTREEALEEVKILLYKKDIDSKSPIKIEDEFVNGFRKLTLYLADKTSLEYQYDKERNRYCREKTPQQAKIMEILYEAETEELIKEKLFKISQDPYLFKWLLELEEYEVEDHNGLYSSVEEIAIQIINELDKTGEVLLEIANIQDISYKVIGYLEERGDKEQLKKLIPLLYSITDKSSYISLVEMFANQKIYEALESIKETMHIIEKDDYYFNELIKARAKLNDLSVIKELIVSQEENSYDDDIEKLINQLIEHYGEMRILDELQEEEKKEVTVKEAYLKLFKSKNKAIGYWALKQYQKKYNECLTLLKYLNSMGWHSKDFIAKELIKSSDDSLNLILKDALESEEFSNKSKYWIVYMLMKRGEDVSHYLKNLRGIKIETPSYISQRLRENIVRFWYKKSIAKTDIRWIIEGMELEKKRSHYNYKKSILKIKKRLKKYNHTIKKSQDCVEKWGMGWSTYHILTIDTPQKKSYKSSNSNCSVEVYDEIHISKVSNHAIYKLCAINFYKGEQQGACNPSISTNETKNRYFKKIIEEAGVNYLNKQEGNFHLPNFNIYFAGKRVENLLFFWMA
ncbi:hypothetical protein MNB_SV-14-1796 [hydrothermal vent metagenome]|uniref:Uncharacterized protein n=1 Tax=hydrothermal vent metagenome TaxID=652676 RepID=A0A1W1CKL6_9ZZZZ